MIWQRWLSRAYRLFDRLLLARLPASLQRAIIASLLIVARHLFPARAWPGSPDRLLARRSLRRAPSQGMPDWARADMEHLALEIDPLLAPERFLAHHPPAVLAPTQWIHAGQAYTRLRGCLPDRQFDTVLLVPWLIRGGADLGALHHARACHDEFGQRTLVIATELKDSPWASRLPDGVHFIAAGHEFAVLNDSIHEPESVLARLLIQLAPARIHIINSPLAWRTVAMFGKAIRQQSRIFASLYCDERDEHGRHTGLAQTYLPAAVHSLDAVISDNTATPLVWQRMLGVPPALFHAVHFPGPMPSQSSSTAATTPHRNRLLWASRLDRQKRPELLLELASSMQDFHWDIHGMPSTINGHILKALNRLSNVTLHGSYEQFHDIVRAEHLAYVYTSAWDGLPNVLLEASSARLPIIAPDIGGIRDLLPETLLLDAQADAGAYSRGIRRLTDNCARENHLALQDARFQIFTWENFVTGMRGIDGYATH